MGTAPTAVAIWLSQGQKRGWIEIGTGRRLRLSLEEIQVFSFRHVFFAPAQEWSIRDLCGILYKELLLPSQIQCNKSRDRSMRASALLAFFPFWMTSEYRSLPERFAAIHRRSARG